MTDRKFNQLVNFHTVMTDDDEFMLDAYLGPGSYETRRMTRDNLRLSRSRKYLVPYYSNGLTQQLYGLTLLDGVESVARAFFTVPYDFGSGMTVSPIINPLTASGDLIYSIQVDYSDIAQTAAVTDDEVEQTEAITASQINLISNLALSAPFRPSLAQISFTRHADDVGDTIGASVYLLGFQIAYTADS